MSVGTPSAAVRTDVLVVGAGLSGLVAGAFLALHGVGVVIAERHPGTSRHPKARLVTARSLEIYRALGVADRVLAAGEPNGGFALADTLAGEHGTWIAPPEDESGSGGDLSPFGPYSCDQQRIEPILRDRAAELGADLRFGTTVHGLATHADGVIAQLTGPDGATTAHARWAVAADGAVGALRERLGIARHGHPVPGTAVSALFRADLSPALRGRRVDALLTRAAGAFLFARGDAADRTWQLGTHLRPDWDANDLDAHVVATIRAATGLPDLAPRIDDVLTWTTGAFVADRFRAGPVFLVGDSAHIMPPYGGFGGNTGVADAHNLAWKLAAVHRGDAQDPLLDTYDTERRPVADLVVAQALLRSRKTPGSPDPPDQIDATTLVLGTDYGRPAHPVEDPAHPTGNPGTRAPHLALRDGRTLLDLLDPTAHTRIRDAGPPAAPGAVVLRRADVHPRHEARWAAVYRGHDVLVRPDGVVAERSAHPAA